jgi:hypothetical protein
MKVLKVSKSGSQEKTETANGTVETYLYFGGYKRIILTNGKITQIDTVR